MGSEREAISPAGDRVWALLSRASRRVDALIGYDRPGSWFIFNALMTFWTGWDGKAWPAAFFAFAAGWNLKEWLAARRTVALELIVYGPGGEVVSRASTDPNASWAEGEKP